MTRMEKMQWQTQAEYLLDCAGEGIVFRQHLDALVKKEIAGQRYQADIKMLQTIETSLMDDAVAIISAGVK